MPENLVRIDLSLFFQLLTHYWACVNSEVGELGEHCFEDYLKMIGKQSQLNVTKDQLAHLLYQFKEAVFAKIPLQPEIYPEPRYNCLMKKLQEDCPTLFKTLASGEVILND